MTLHLQQRCRVVTLLFLAVATGLILFNSLQDPAESVLSEDSASHHEDAPPAVEREDGRQRTASCRCCRMECVSERCINCHKIAVQRYLAASGGERDWLNRSATWADPKDIREASRSSVEAAGVQFKRTFFQADSCIWNRNMVFNVTTLAPNREKRQKTRKDVAVSGRSRLSSSCECGEDSQVHPVHLCQNSGFPELLTECSSLAQRLEPETIGGADSADGLRLARIKNGPLLACYRTNDVVCGSTGHSGSWEPSLVMLIRYAMAQLVVDRLNATFGRAVTMEEAGPIATAREKRLVELVDIGGNVGVFGLTMWRLGYSVKMFEALPSNVNLLKIGFCLNQFEVQSEVGGGSGNSMNERRPKAKRPLREATSGPRDPRSTNTTLRWEQEPGLDFSLYQVALGSTHGQQCALVSDEGNQGDAHLLCNESIVHQKEDTVLGGEGIGTGLRYRRRAIVRVQRLDDYVQEWFANDGVEQRHPHEEVPSAPQDKDYVVKIDVEGHEPQVMEGARGWLSDVARRPKFILSEVWLTNLDSVLAYIHFMFEVRYDAYFESASQWFSCGKDTTRESLQTALDHLKLHVAPRIRAGHMENIVFTPTEYRYLLISPLGDPGSMEGGLSAMSMGMSTGSGGH